MKLALVPPVLPEETLASYAVRTWLLSGRQEFGEFCAALFGAPWREPDHLLPTSVGTFAATMKSFGKATDAHFWLINHSHFQYFSAGLPSKRIKIFERRLTNSKFGPKHPTHALTWSDWLSKVARFCPECASLDRKAFGVAHVRRDLVSPYVTRCPVHGARLAEAISWAPPLLPSFPRSSRTSSSGVANNAVLFSCWSQQFVRRGLQFGQHELTTLLDRLGLITAGGSIRRQLISQTISQRFHEGFEDESLGALISNRSELDSAIRRLASTRRGPYPAIIILLCATFLDPKAGLLSAPSRKVTHTSQSEHDAHRTEAIVEVLRASPTLTAAARELGLSATTVSTIARRNGLERSFRPKIVDDAVRKTLSNALLDGISISEAAVRTQVSLSTAYRIVGATAGLAEQLRALKLERQRARRRAAWLDLRARLPNAAYTELRRCPDGVWSWLYKSDRLWLEANRPNKPAINQGGRQEKHLPEQHMIGRMRAAGIKLAARPGKPIRCSPTALAAAAGISRHYLYSSYAGNAAVANIRMVCDTPKSFAYKRLEWAALQLQAKARPLRAWAVIKASGLRSATVTKSSINVDLLICEQMRNTKRRHT